MTKAVAETGPQHPRSPRPPMGSLHRQRHSRAGERFNAIVTRASDKGTWVRIFEPALEEKVVRGFETLDVGDRLRVELVHTDVERGFMDFVRVRETG